MTEEPYRCVCERLLFAERLSDAIIKIPEHMGTKIVGMPCQWSRKLVLCR